jgi:GNAT superfamily N-acetyltransferase
MNENAKIDSLKSSDLQGLKNLYEQGFESPATDFSNMLNAYDLIKNNKNYNILCAKVNELIVGSVMGIICFELYGECKPFMVLENVVVLKEFRKQGIAKRLMIQMEELAREHNCSMILFVSSGHRIGAHKLYESLGFGLDKVNGYRKRLQYG